MLLVAVLEVLLGVEVTDVAEDVPVMEEVVRAALKVDERAVVGLALALLQYEVCCSW